MKLKINNREVLATKKMLGERIVLSIQDVEAKKYLTTLIKELVIASEYKIKIPYELLDGSESGFFDGCFFLNDVIYFDYWKKK